MSARKKTWIKSAFSQLDTVTNNNNIKDIEPAVVAKVRRSTRNINVATPDASPLTRRSSRGKKDPKPTEAVEVIDVDEDTKEETKNLQVQQNENWIERFAPTCTEELAVHSKKIDELQNWFHHCDFMGKSKQPAQLCLLTGPSGSGKTEAVRTVAKEVKYSIQEWINPVDVEVIYKLGDQPYGDSKFTNSQVEVFKDFLFKASRYSSLFEVNREKRLLMIEDFPNFLLRDSSAFEVILNDYILYGKSPLIFIVTDAKRRGLNISYNIFTDQLKEKFRINHISFNPVAATLMQKAVKRFCDIMLLPPYNAVYCPPKANLLESIIVSAQGDVRNALINLHFSSLKGAPNLVTRQLKMQASSQDTKLKSRKRKPQSALKSVGRGDSISLMHALGRVFHPKYTDDKKLLHSPEEIAEAFTNEPKTFIDLIHANYLLRFPDIESVSSAINGISLSDLILHEYRDDTLSLTALNVAIRNVMVSNTCPVTAWMTIKGPKRLNSDSSKIPLNALKMLPVEHRLSKNIYALDYKTFLKIIAPET